MIVGALADVHGNFDAMTHAMERHPDVPFWLCVGDLASGAGEYPEPTRPLYWIKGNNENFDRIAAWQAGEAAPRNLHFIPNGTAVVAGPLRVAGLGGTFAPTWFDTPAAQLPHAPSAGTPVRRSLVRDDKRRHFVREEAESCKRLARIDVLMTHEAARPFVVVSEPRSKERPQDVPADQRAKGRRLDAGKPAINDVLASLKPRLHLCGHHHRFIESEREGVRSVCLDRVNRSYLLIDARTLEYRKVDQ